MKEDFIILIHKFGYEQLNNEVTRQDLYDYLAANGVDVESGIVRGNLEHILAESFVNTGGSHMEQRLIFKSEAYYRYLDYLELKQARADSKEARWWSIAALAVSIILAVIQIAAS